MTLVPTSKKYRTAKGITQEQLGELVGVTTQAVSKWERGGTPDAELLPQLSEVLEVSIVSLPHRGTVVYQSVTGNDELGQPLHFEPGSEMEYCNFNYTLLGLIVEQLSGQSYQEYITENFFNPLGMTHSGFVSLVKENPEWAKGLTYDTMQETDLIGLPQGAGDIVTNAADIELRMTALRTGQVVSFICGYISNRSRYRSDYCLRYNCCIR